MPQSMEGGGEGVYNSIMSHEFMTGSLLRSTLVGSRPHIFWMHVYSSTYLFSLIITHLSAGTWGFCLFCVELFLGSG